MSVLDFVPSWIIAIGMPFAVFYQAFCVNLFWNVDSEQATGVEKVANICLQPIRYLCAGNNAHTEDGIHYTFYQSDDYNSHFAQKTLSAFLSLPTSVFFGATLKASSYLFPEIRERYFAMRASRDSLEIHSNLAWYKEIGLDVSNYKHGEIVHASHIRRPGSEHHLSEAKECLREIIRVLDLYEIPSWMDCGTCLGAYRYGGVIPWDEDVDVAVLLPDYENVKRALTKELDPEKYTVFDCSGRSHPDTYLKVYIKSNQELVDIYHFAVDPEKKELQYILSLEDNIFLTEAWRVRESRFTHPSPFSEIFPLKRAIFDGIEVPVPNLTKKYLQGKYGENIEPAKLYNELTDSYENDLSHPYWQRAHVH